MKKLSNQTKSAMTESLKLPREIVYQEPVLTMSGMREAYVENYRGVLECNAEKIVVQAKHERIIFQGRGLEIIYYSAEDMKVTGCITQINFSEVEAVW